MPNEVVKYLIGDLSNIEIYKLNLVNLKIHSISIEIILQRKEDLLINLYGKFINEFKPRAIAKANVYITNANKLPHISHERIDEIRGAFASLICEKNNSLIRGEEVLKYNLAFYPSFYQDKQLLEMLFKTHSPVGNLTSSRQASIRYSFEFLEAWKNEIISPKNVKMDIHRAIDTKLASAFAEVIRLNTSVKRVVLYLIEISEWENLREVFLALKENKKIKRIDIYSVHDNYQNIDHYKIKWCGKFILDYYCEMLQKQTNRYGIIDKVFFKIY
ncbi:MAG: hypothetical protein H0U27_02305 [Nitrosopumilus sp.]|nr:hypothetical protein [Nitrosopumilus sp.]